MLVHDFVAEVYVPHRLMLAASTIEQYTIAARSLERFYLEPVHVADLTDELVLPWLSKRLGQVSPRTVKRERGDVLTIWKWAHRKGHCSSPPVDIPTIPVPRKLPIYWTVNELERLLVACRAMRGEMRGLPIAKSSWWSSMVLFLYDTGARLSAAMNVATHELDLAARSVLLNAVFSKTRIEQQINLSDQTIAAVAAHYSADRPLVWPYPYNRRQVWPQLKSILKTADLPRDRYRMFHCFRRTTATLTAANSSIEVAQQQLGHASLSMTRLYVNPAALGQTQAVDVLPRPSF